MNQRATASVSEQLKSASSVGRKITCGLFAVLALTALGQRGASAASPDVINAIGVENEYADVIAQIGGKYVRVTAIESDPNTDPHTFEASPKIAAQIATAGLIVENGIGYDDWADKIIAAAPISGRKVINVQHLLGLPDSTPNPHLWYDPKTMPAVAQNGGCRSRGAATGPCRIFPGQCRKI